MRTRLIHPSVAISVATGPPNRPDSPIGSQAGIDAVIRHGHERQHHAKRGTRAEQQAKQQVSLPLVAGDVDDLAVTEDDCSEQADILQELQYPGGVQLHQRAVDSWRRSFFRMNVNWTLKVP